MSDPQAPRTESSDRDEQPQNHEESHPDEQERPVNPDYAETDDEERFASGDALTFQRDEEGDLVPNEVFVEELEQMGHAPYALAKPFHGDQRQRYLEDPADPDSDVEELTDADLAELFERNLIRPDLHESPACEGRITERFVSEELPEPAQDACFIAVLLASGEHEYVRRMRRLQRGELTDAEVKMMQHDREQQSREDDRMQPASDRSRNQARRDRRNS